MMMDFVCMCAAHTILWTIMWIQRSILNWFFFAIYIADTYAMHTTVYTGNTINTVEKD